MKGKNAMTPWDLKSDIINLDSRVQVGDVNENQYWASVFLQEVKELSRRHHFYNPSLLALSVDFHHSALFLLSYSFHLVSF